MSKRITEVGGIIKSKKKTKGMTAVLDDHYTKCETSDCITQWWNAQYHSEKENTNDERIPISNCSTISTST